ncbi:MAG: hypothetical protein WC401_08955 [Bacteroidales bacterium]|jgi:thioredoxin-related protein|nr:hypothetical protein [Bacteroidales bacterium]
MKKLKMLFIAVVFILSGCSGSSDKKTDINSGDTVIALADEGKPVYERYGLKSAILHMKSKTMGMEQDVIMYFDDYGKKQCNELSIELLGKIMKQITITDSGYMYTYTTADKNGTKIKLDENSPDKVNFNALTEEMVKKFNIKKTGTAVILDKKCDVYTAEHTSAKMKGTYYVWKGFIMKAVSSVAGIEVKMEAVKLEENPVIPAEKFEIPEDINIQLIDNTKDVVKK